MAAASFRVSWNRFPSHVLSALDNLRLDEDFVDVSIYCGRQLIKAHRNVLSASSDYFKEIFKANPSSHPVVILCDVDHASLRSLVDFMYHGEIEVPTARLDELLRLGEMLQVQGISSHQGLKVEDPGSAPPEPEPESPLPPGDVISPECVISEPGCRRRRSRHRTSSAGEEAAASHVTPDGGHSLLAVNGHGMPEAAPAAAHGSSLACGLSDAGGQPADLNFTGNSLSPPVGHGMPTPVGHGLPTPVGHSLPPPVGHSMPPPVGHSMPPPVGHSIPPPVGHGLPPPVGHGLPLPVGHSLPPVGHSLPPPVGHGLPPPAAHSMSAPAGLSAAGDAPPLTSTDLHTAPAEEQAQPSDGGPLPQLRVKTEWPEEAAREPAADAADSKLLLDDSEQSGLDMSQYSGGIFAGGMGSRRPLTGAERARRYRERKKLKKLYETLLGGSPRREQLTVQL